MKIVLFVEGHTEKQALAEFFKLDPQLACTRCPYLGRLLADMLVLARD